MRTIHDVAPHGNGHHPANPGLALLALQAVEQMAADLPTIGPAWARHGLPADRRRVLRALETVLARTEDLVRQVLDPPGPLPVLKRAICNDGAGVCWLGLAERHEDGTWFFHPDSFTSGWFCTEADLDFPVQR